MTLLSDLLHRRGVAAASALQILALLPPVAVVVAERGFGAFQILVAGAITALFWEALFASTRKQKLSAHGLTTAMIVAVFAPADLPVWQLAVVMSLGVIIGELVFGGRGFGFLNAAAVSLALMAISFPGVTFAAPDIALALACLPGAALLFAAGLLSWQIVIATLAGFGLAGLAAGAPFEPVAVFAGLTFAIVFLIGDPVAAATTVPGRFVYGLLAGALIALFGGAELPIDPGAIVPAAVLVSVFAPMIDHILVLATMRLAERRHG
jgi:Na+-transporting NADH:ubiquinone oxidoreductase subunit B